jgi:type IV secretion system protein VirD4
VPGLVIDQAGLFLPWEGFMIRRWWSKGIRAVLLLVVGLMATDAVLLGLQYPFIGCFALAAAGWKKTRRVWKPSDAYGSARFAGLGDLVYGKLLEHRGLILGKVGFLERPSPGQAVRMLLSPFVTSEWACRQFFVAFLGSRWIGDVFIRVQNFTHLLTVAPSGGGKSVNTLVPNLLSYPGNCVVVDPKGELFSLTSEHRRKAFGHKVIRLDPAGLCGPGGKHFNPFDFIDAESKAFLGQCRDMANMLVTRTGREDDPHWNQSAENVIAALIAYVCACEGDRDCRNLQGMRVFLASPENFEAAQRMMCAIDGFDGVLHQLGESLSWHQEREGASVMSNVQRHTNIFDDPMIAESTALTDWNPKELRDGRMTVYLIVPPDRLVVWAAWQRMVLGHLIRIITRGVPNEKNPVLFLIDECGHIGKMEALENAITLLRGAGIRVWLFFQSLDQLNRCFGDNAPTVLDNLKTQQYFAINSYSTADELSKRIGDTTVAVQSGGDNSGSSRPVGGSHNNPPTRNSGTSFNTSEAARRLLKPEEILGLSDDAALVFHNNLPVIPAKRIRYYEDKAFRRGGVGTSRGLGLGGAVAASAALCVTCICSLPLLSPAPVPDAAPMPQIPVEPAYVDTRPLRPRTVVASEPPPLPSPRHPLLTPPSITPTRPFPQPFTPLGRRQRPSPYGGLNHGEEN